MDGLTNDEVKSHLQKYRLHTRRPSPSPPSPSAHLPQMVILGWVGAPPECTTGAVFDEPPPAIAYEDNRSPQPTKQPQPQSVPDSKPAVSTSQTSLRVSVHLIHILCEPCDMSHVNSSRLFGSLFAFHYYDYWVEIGEFHYPRKMQPINSCVQGVNFMGINYENH